MKLHENSNGKTICRPLFDVISGLSEVHAEICPADAIISLSIVELRLVAHGLNDGLRYVATFGISI